MTLISNGRGGTREAEATPAIIAGTLVTTDLARARKFYEDFLGMECVRHAPGRMLVRDKRARDLMSRGERGGFVLEVEEVDEVKHPQKMHHHWGFDAASVEEVDRIRETALSDPERYGIKKVNPVTKMHGSYQFYFIDMDDNWWEIEFRLHGRNNEQVFEGGDFKREEAPAKAEG